MLGHCRHTHFTRHFGITACHLAGRCSQASQFMHIQNMNACVFILNNDMKLKLFTVLLEQSKVAFSSVLYLFPYENTFPGAQDVASVIHVCATSCHVTAPKPARLRPEPLGAAGCSPCTCGHHCWCAAADSVRHSAAPHSWHGSAGSLVWAAVGRAGVLVGQGSGCDGPRWLPSPAAAAAAQWFALRS